MTGIRAPPPPSSFLSLALLLLSASVALILVVLPVEASFNRDVLLPGQRQQWVAQNKQRDELMLQQELLEKAMSRREFELKYGVSLDGAPVIDATSTTTTEESTRNRQQNQRFLDEDNGNNNGEGDDDYYMNYNNMYSFSGYSIKFAKCQPVQYFSENALAAGEHSPMVTDDIVILRLCPTSSCSSDKEYGCQYNFSEYALELADYVRIMLRFSSQKRDYMCQYCEQCLEDGGGGGGNNGGDERRQRNRRLDDGEGEGNEGEGEGEENGEGEEQGDQEGEEEGGEQGEEEENGDEQQGGDDNVNAGDDNNYAGYGGYNGDDYYTYACDTWSTYCTDYSELCVDQQEENEDNNNGNAAYIDYEDYLDYLDCSEVKYNDYAYFVRPRCDGYQGTIKMAVYYDNYCVQYAGNEVSLKNLGLGFKESAFADFYDGQCMDCSESEYPPYDATSTLCNRLHADSAKCTDDMEYDLFGGEEESSQTECKYIESLRFGTYNELGQLSTKNGDGSVAQEMTQSQKAMLAISILICVLLVVYACYLHHAMTNLLIKSLSHRELLPPSRHSANASQAASSRRNSPRRTGRRLKKVGGEPDWDDHEGEYA